MTPRNASLRSNPYQKVFHTKSYPGILSIKFDVPLGTLGNKPVPVCGPYHWHTGTLAQGVTVHVWEWEIGTGRVCLFNYWVNKKVMKHFLK